MLHRNGHGSHDPAERASTPARGENTDRPYEGICPRLPPEVIAEILGHLPGCARAVYRAVCADWGLAVAAVDARLRTSARSRRRRSGRSRRARAMRRRIVARAQALGKRGGQNLCAALAKAGMARLALTLSRERGYRMDARTCAGAAGAPPRAGDGTDDLRMLRAAGCPLDRRTCAAAAGVGSLERLKFARLPDSRLLWLAPCDWDGATCASAAGAGNLECLRWAYHWGCPMDERTCEAAARADALDCLQWARVKGMCRWTARTAERAARAGSMAALGWAMSRWCPLGKSLVIAAEAGKLEAVTHLCTRIASPVVWGDVGEACQLAALRGRVACLRYLLELLVASSSIPSEAGKQVCRAAATGGHLCCLSVARAAGCSWDERVCANSAYGGRVALLRWARDNGCPWNESVCRAALERGRVACLRYAHEHGAPWRVPRCCELMAGKARGLRTLHAALDAPPLWRLDRGTVRELLCRWPESAAFVVPPEDGGDGSRKIGRPVLSDEEVRALEEVEARLRAPPGPSAVPWCPRRSAVRVSVCAFSAPVLLPESRER